MNRSIEEIANSIVQHNGKRTIVAIAGPPASGKSTLADKIAEHINRSVEADCALVMPMDGYHLDNILLDQDDTRNRKGAVHTFDFDGIQQTLQRVAEANAPVVIPTFDRELDLARAGARRISANHRYVLVEGNYLLLSQPPWQQLYSLFDFRIFLEVPDEILLNRLQQRWIDHNHTPEMALKRAQENDLPNAQQVMRNRMPADLVLCIDE